MSATWRFIALAAILAAIALASCSEVVGADFDVRPRSQANGGAGGEAQAGSGGTATDGGGGAGLGGGTGGSPGGAGGEGGSGGAGCWVDGTPCTDGALCCSGRCIDGTCCDTTCTGTCEACAQAQTGLPDGTCGPILEGLDPADECTGELVCNGSSGCCGGAANPTGVGTPPICDTTVLGTCFIAANVDSEFENLTIDCPAGFHCLVECSGQSSCKDAVVNCPAGAFRCEVDCSCAGGPTNCCERTDVNCAAGPCTLDCAENDGCKAPTLNCGVNACTATCAEAANVNVTCGASCDCTDGC